MCARVNAPPEEQLLRPIVDSLPQVQSSREGRGLVAEMSVKIAGQDGAAAIRVADEIEDSHPSGGLMNTIASCRQAFP
jgi:hypothetical protein